MIKTTAIVTVASAGTAQAVTATRTPICWFKVMGDPANTGNVYWGSSIVTAANGQAVAAGGSDQINPHLCNITDLADIYIDSDANGAIARVVYSTV